jgi:hypothetical protein
MSGRQHFFPLLLCAGVLVAACNDDRDSTALTSPSFAAKPACNATAIDRAIRAAFTDNANKQTVLGIAQSLGNAYGSGDFATPPCSVSISCSTSRRRGGSRAARSPAPT